MKHENEMKFRTPCFSTLLRALSICLSIAAALTSGANSLEVYMFLIDDLTSSTEM